MHRTVDGWIDEYEKRGALYIYNGDPKYPHPVLTSHFHSSGFFNSRLVISDRDLLQQAVSDLAELFLLQSPGNPNIVAGPQKGATELAKLLSLQLSFVTGVECSWMSPEKGLRDGKKCMVFSPKDREALSGAFILPCEDVVTTGGSVELMIDEVKDADGMVMDYILCLVNRSGLGEIGGKNVIALIEYEMPKWTAEECPLCKEGSPPVFATKDNWSRFASVQSTFL